MYIVECIIQGGQVKKNLESYENENTTSQNLWDIAKTVLRGKFIAMNAYTKEIEVSNEVYRFFYAKKNLSIIPTCQNILA
jgi:hypothetical protein